jgi:SnoaL-like domain
MSSVQTGLQELLDKQAITEALFRYARSMDRLDRELGYSVFWPEATADYDQQMYQGTGHGFVDMCMEAHPTFHSHSHQFSNILITVNGDTATSETYGDVTLRQVVDDGTYVDMRNLGRYIDRWERRNNEWRIISRIYLHDFDETNPSGGAFTTTGRRDRNDPSYFGGERI